MRGQRLVKRGGILGLAVWIAPAAGVVQAPVCDETSVSADLYCFDLISRPDISGTTGRVAIRRPSSPFGAVADRDGVIRQDISVEISGLPDPATLGEFTTYVAWATTPLLRPFVRLGEVTNGVNPLGTIALNKFIIMVSAEASGEVTERRGRLVLRGTSPSMRMQPDQHLTPSTLLQATAQGEAGSAEWTPPPMHPSVPMVPTMSQLRPRVRPFLPNPPPETVTDAVPRRLVELDDGDTLALVARPVWRTIAGKRLVMYGFNGQYPGPLLYVAQRSTVVVDFTNGIDLPTAIHWHGLRLDNRFDGVPGLTQEPVEPGETFRYEVHFPDAGIYWYHPHHREDIQQELGLYGNMIVRSDDPDYYGPAHREEILMLDDLLLGDDGVVPFGLEGATHALMGRFGNHLLVNGEPGYRLAVDRGEVVRFYLTNVSNTRTFNVSLPGMAFKVVASDVGKFEFERWVDNVVIAPAERYVVEARFDTPGTVPLINSVQGLNHFYGSYFNEVDTLGVVTVGPSAARPDLEASFARLRTNDDVRADIDPYRDRFDRPIDYEIRLRLETDGLPLEIDQMLKIDSVFFNPVEWSGTMPMMNWVSTTDEIRWLVSEPSTGREDLDIAWRFRVGDVVKLRITNDRSSIHAMQHPVHIHGQRFLVVAQNGQPNDNLVWKDTILLPVGGTADLILELSNPGRWMLHCHIAEHLESGMRTVFEVVP